MRLELIDLHYSYAQTKAGTAVLSGVNFTAEAGSYWCLAGSNGTGKSTLLKLISGLLPIHSSHFRGQILWDGKPLAAWDRLNLARKIAFVPGALRTQFPVSVADFVLQGRFSHTDTWSRPNTNDRKIAEAAAERVGIKHLYPRLLTELSSGETQLALLARALTQQPQALILDEATANLDLGYQSRIFKLISELNAEGKTIMLVSHDLNLATEFCPKMVWIQDGTCVAQGAVAEVLTTDFIRKMYGEDCLIEVGQNPLTARPKLFWRASHV